MNLEHTVSQIQAAETGADGVEILREAIEKFVGEKEKGETVQALCPDGIQGCCVYHTQFVTTERIIHRNALRHELIASIQPKEMK